MIKFRVSWFCLTKFSFQISYFPSIAEWLNLVSSFGVPYVSICYFIGSKKILSKLHKNVLFEISSRLLIIFFNKPFHPKCCKMARHTLKILRCLHHKFSKYILPFYNIVHERVKHFNMTRVKVFTVDIVFKKFLSDCAYTLSSFGFMQST